MFGVKKEDQRLIQHVSLFFKVKDKI